MAEIEPGEYIDTYINLPNKERGSEEGMDPNIRRWFLKSSPDLLGGVTTEHWVNKMTAAGIERGLLNFGMAGDTKNPFSPRTADFTLDDFRKKCEEIAGICRDYPGRIFGTCNIDPNHRMDAVRMVEIAVKEYDFRAVRMMGAITNCEPNHKLCYPIYTKCIELGIPIVINAGFPGPLRFAKYQRPLHLDEVLVAFPELTVVATHIGHPWHLETVALLQKHANIPPHDVRLRAQVRPRRDHPHLEHPRPAQGDVLRRLRHPGLPALRRRGAQAPPARRRAAQVHARERPRNLPHGLGRAARLMPSTERKPAEPPGSRGVRVCVSSEHEPGHRRGRSGR